jgi:hypothetical protein
MGIAALAVAIMSSQSALKQTELGMSFERMNADKGTSIANLVDSAQQNIKSLADAGAGLGGKVNTSA